MSRDNSNINENSHNPSLSQHFQSAPSVEIRGKSDSGPNDFRLPPIGRTGNLQNAQTMSQSS